MKCTSLSLILCFIYKLYATHYYGYTLGSSFLFVVEFIPVFHNNTLPFNEFQFLKEISVRNFRGCSFRATGVVFLVPFALNILFWPIFYIWQTHKNRLNVLCEYIIKEKNNDSNVSLLVFCHRVSSSQLCCYSYTSGQRDFSRAYLTCNLTFVVVKRCLCIQE